MSKIKIQGNASGTGVLTVTAPNSNTDRTITLPDGDVTLGAATPSITDNGNATAITITSAENVRVSGSVTDADKALLSTWQSTADAGTAIGSNLGMAVQHDGGANSLAQLGFGYIANNAPAVIGYQVETSSNNTKGDLFFATRDTTADIAPTERLRITVDGRGLSQFTAKAWVNFNGTGTVAIRDSHNVSSITDNGTGQYAVTFTNAMSSVNYSYSTGARDVNNQMGIPVFQADPTRTVTTSSLPLIYNYPPNVSYYDPDTGCVQVFGD